MLVNANIKRKPCYVLKCPEKKSKVSPPLTLKEMPASPLFKNLPQICDESTNVLNREDSEENCDETTNVSNHEDSEEICDE